MQGRQKINSAKCTTFIVFLMINIFSRPSGLAFAAKEEAEENGGTLLSPKVEDSSFLGENEETLNSSPKFVHEDDKWRFPCFVFPNHFDPSNPYFEYFNGENSDVVKRNFNPWGGKRSRISEYIRRMSEMSKKGGFNPWGGKRYLQDTSISRSSKSEYPGSRRLPFNPWGGR